MGRLKRVFLLVSILFTVICLSQVDYQNNSNYGYIFGQADIELIKNYNITTKESHNNISKRGLYLGSINIIEKYLTIYVILYILRYYVKSKKVDLSST